MGPRGPPGPPGKPGDDVSVTVATKMKCPLFARLYEVSFVVFGVM